MKRLTYGPTVFRFGVHVVPFYVESLRESLPKYEVSARHLIREGVWEKESSAGILFEMPEPRDGYPKDVRLPLNYPSTTNKHLNRLCIDANI